MEDDKRLKEGVWRKKGFKPPLNLPCSYMCLLILRVRKRAISIILQQGSGTRVPQYAFHFIIGKSTVYNLDLTLILCKFIIQNDVVGFKFESTYHSKLWC